MMLTQHECLPACNLGYKYDEHLLSFFSPTQPKSRKDESLSEDTSRIYFQVYFQCELPHRLRHDKC